MFHRVFRSLRARLAMAVMMLFAATFLMPTVSVSAHEERVVATNYSFVVGFINEPAVQNDTNGLSLAITRAGAPVLAASDTLRAQVILADQTRDLTLLPAFREAGVYESVFIPTQPGDYTFRIYGQLEGVAIDESFTSSPEGFDAVRMRSDLEFPIIANGNQQERDPVTLAFPVIAGGAVLALAGGAIALRRRSGQV